MMSLLAEMNAVKFGRAERSDYGAIITVQLQYQYITEEKVTLSP
jgi:hypothetical protein